MFETTIPKQERQKPIRASWLNQVRAAALRALNLQVEAPLELIPNGAGMLLRLVHRPRRFLTITSGMNPYAWTEATATAGGGWTAGSMAGSTASDPAYEANANTMVPAGTVVLARRTLATGTWIFQLSPCGT